MTTSDKLSAAESTSEAGSLSAPNLKAVLVLVLVLILGLVAGAAYLIKNNEPVARQLLSWNLELPSWLLPASVSQSTLRPDSSGSLGSPSSSSTAVSPEEKSASAQESTASGESAALAGPVGSATTPATTQGQGSAFTPPSAPVRPTPQLDPAFRQSLEAIDRLVRSLLVLPVGPQKPSLPGVAVPKSSGSLLAGVEEQAPDAQPASTSLAQGEPNAQMLEPGVFEKSLQFLQSLLRVQSTQGPDFAAQSQTFYELVRQQMQAQLAAARLALLLGEVTLAERELEQTEALLERHFDKADPKVFQLQAEFSGLRRQVESLQ
ncbi:MAG: hypothetical protein VW440_06060 [Bordetella sp.]